MTLLIQRDPGVIMSTKLLQSAIAAALLALLGSIGLQAQNAMSDAAAAQPFLGRWDLTVNAPGRAYPAWLELRWEEGQLKGRMVGQWAHAQPLIKADLSGGTLAFVSPQGEWDRKDDMPFEGKLVGGRLAGTTKGPDGTRWTWTGQRAPDLKRKGEPKWGKPVELFNG
jgi:hypothetical protein